MIQWSNTAAASLNGVKILVYGPSGIGKTRLCATAPAPLIVSAEAGLLSLRNNEVPVALVRNIDELTEIYSWAANSKEAWAFSTICLDSLTEIAEVFLASAKRTVKDPRQAYGEMLEKMLVLVKAFRDLPGRNIYMSAKQEWTKDEATGICRYQPMMPGQKLGPQLPYLFDEVFRMGLNKTAAGQEFTFLQTKGDLQYDAKDRSGALDPLEPPDLSVIIRKITGGQ